MIFRRLLFLHFEEFAGDFNREYAFLTSPAEQILLDGGALSVRPIATTSPQYWKDNPIVDDDEISVAQASYPDEYWRSGADFVYEPGNWAVKYYISQYFTDPPHGFGGEPGDDDQSALQKRAQPRSSLRRLTSGGPDRQSATDATSNTRNLPADNGVFPSQEQRDNRNVERVVKRGHPVLLSGAASDGQDLLTIPGPAVSAGQRDALMRSPAFSDPSDPMFGPAVAKYREANAAGADRAVALGVVDGFGQPVRPLFADRDGALADAGGQSIGEARHSRLLVALQSCARLP